MFLHGALHGQASLFLPCTPQYQVTVHSASVRGLTGFLENPLQRGQYTPCQHLERRCGCEGLLDDSLRFAIVDFMLSCRLPVNVLQLECANVGELEMPMFLDISNERLPYGLAYVPSDVGRNTFATDTSCNVAVEACTPSFCARLLLLSFDSLLLHHRLRCGHCWPAFAGPR